MYMYSRGLDILYSPRELEIEHLPGDPVVLGLGEGGHVDGHDGRARPAGVHSLGGVYICCTPLYRSGEKSAYVKRRESFGRDRLLVASFSS